MSRDNHLKQNRFNEKIVNFQRRRKKNFEIEDFLILDQDFRDSLIEENKDIDLSDFL